MPKKALIFIEDGSFTYDSRVKHEADALVKNGWSITVICPKYKNDPFYKKIDNNLRVYYFIKPNARIAAMHIIEHSFSLFFGFLFSFWVFIRHGFSVFHACNPMDILWIIALPYKIFGVKFIFDQHDLCPELYLSRAGTNEKSFFFKLLLLLERLSYLVADRIIVTNESYKQIATERGRIHSNQVYVVRNGPDLASFQRPFPRRSLKSKKGEILVGYLGNMNAQDGLDYLLEAIDLLINTYNEKKIKFILIGDGSSLKSIMEMSKKKLLDEYIVFAGRHFGKDMISILSACDICVQPDPRNPLNDKSTMSKALEYMALEKPIVAFDLKETRYSCQDAALYAKSNDINQFAEHILCLSTSSSLRTKMGQAGRKRIEKGLSWEYSVPNLLSAYGGK